MIKFIRFGIVGLGSTVINFIIYNSMIFFDTSIFLSSIISYITGLSFSFIFGKIWVFENSGGKNTYYQLSKFIFIYLLSLVGYTQIISYFTGLGIHENIAWLIAIIFSTITNFLGSKYVVFIK